MLSKWWWDERRETSESTWIIFRKFAYKAHTSHMTNCHAAKNRPALKDFSISSSVFLDFCKEKSRFQSCLLPLLSARLFFLIPSRKCLDCLHMTTEERGRINWHTSYHVVAQLHLQMSVLDRLPLFHLSLSLTLSISPSIESLLFVFLSTNLNRVSCTSAVAVEEGDIL